VWSAFGFSAALHLLVVILYPLLFERIGPEASPFFPPSPSVPLQGTPVIRLIEIDQTPDAERPDDPDEIEELEEPAAEAEAPILEALPGIEVVPLGPTAAERLRPHLVDARIWRALPPEFFELTFEQREELALADRLTTWLDSAQTARAAADALTDWTFTDSRGGRWGVSPGQIHLGDITIPLPLSFGTPLGKRDENNRLIWQWEEIMRQAARADVEIMWRERAAAIRARRDAERAAARPDTTRSR
jgi:hypothetical protein